MERGGEMRAEGRKGERWIRGGWRRGEREEGVGERQTEGLCERYKAREGGGGGRGRTREMRYRLQPADKSKVIGPSGILRSRTTKSTASSRYVATYVHMYHGRPARGSAHVGMYVHVLYRDYVYRADAAAYIHASRQRG